MEQSPDKLSSTCQKIPSILWNPKDYYRICVAGNKTIK